MRIIAGRLRSRRLVAPAGDNTRPTTDRVKESLFQHLESAHLDKGFHGARVLDLFAGSGALGLECLSRGAEHALFIDADRRSIKAIRTNVDALQLGAQTQIIAGKLPAALRRVKATGPFDLVFADPPYTHTDLAPLIAALAELQLVARGAHLIYERGSTPEPVEFDGWESRTTRPHGETTIHVFRRAEHAEP